MGKVVAMVKVIPAVITEKTFLFFPSARYLVINLETVIGVPEEVSVKRRAKTDKATW